MWKSCRGAGRPGPTNTRLVRIHVSRFSVGIFFLLFIPILLVTHTINGIKLFILKFFVTFKILLALKLFY